MREYKFRGKAETEEMCGEWVYGWYVGKTNLSPPSIITEIDGVFKSVPIIPETVGQYTGRKDKNGREIYKGDIVETGFGERASIEYIDKACGFYLNVFHIETKEQIPLTLDWEDDIEKIGNKADNPELLEG